MHAVLPGFERNQDPLIGVGEALPPFFRQQPEDFEPETPDHQFLADHGLAVGLDQPRNGASEHGHAAAGVAVAMAEVSSSYHVHVVHGHVLGRRRDDADIRVPATVLDLKVAGQLRDDGAKSRGVRRESSSIVGGEADPAAARYAAPK